MKFPNMFSPVQIGTVTVPNRFVVPPMLQQTQATPA